MPLVTSEGPRGRGLIVSNPHPTGLAAATRLDITKAQAAFPERSRGPLAGRLALVVGGTSRGYGAAVGTALWAAGADVDAVGWSSPPKVKGDRLQGHADWFVANAMREAGVYRRIFLGDGFQDLVRNTVLCSYAAATEVRPIDYLVYAIAAGKRSYGGQTWNAALKIAGDPYTALALDHETEMVAPTEIPAASPDEITGTVKCMGGEDLAMWVVAAKQAGVLANQAVVMGFDYIGFGHPDVDAVYVRTGTMGQAKRHLRATIERMDGLLAYELDGAAVTLEFPAVPTTASLHIPAVKHYLAALYGAGLATGLPVADPIDVGIKVAQLFGRQNHDWHSAREYPLVLRQMGRTRGVLRFDQEEGAPAIQSAIAAYYDSLTAGPVAGIGKSGLEVFRGRFKQLFGYEAPGIDYTQPFEGEPPLANGIVNLLAA